MRILKWVFLKIKEPDFKKNEKRLLSPIIDDLPWSAERERWRENSPMCLSGKTDARAMDVTEVKLTRILKLKDVELEDEYHSQIKAILAKRYKASPQKANDLQTKQCIAGHLRFCPSWD